MSTSHILKGRPIEVLPQVSIWDYVESKVKHFSSKVAQEHLARRGGYAYVYGKVFENGRESQHLYQELIPDEKLPHHRTFEAVDRQLRGTGSLEVDADTKQEITFTEILHKSKKLSEGLAARGITYGDVIAICSENNLDYCWIVLGVLRAGASCALLSPTYTAREWEHALSISQPKLVICSMNVCEMKLEQYLKSGSVKQVLVWDSKGKSLPQHTVPLEEILDSTSVVQMPTTEKLDFENYSTVISAHDVKEKHESGHKQTRDLPAFILSSSGSTGLPKGVVLTHFNITTALTTSGDYTSSTEIALGVPPFCHAYGLLLVLMCLCEGTCVVVVRKFNPDLFIHSIEEHKITCLYLVASLLVLLLKRDVLDKPECSSVRHIWTGAAPLSPKLQQLALEKLAGRAMLHHSYGLTETTFTMFTCSVDNCRLGTPGKVTPGMECKVVDVKTGKIIGPNCKGELCFRGPLLMKEYMMNIEETHKAFDVDGWFHSGDLGYYDEDGYFYIVDRLKELIKYQGYQVSPSELESILVMHPAVQDAAIIGIEDEVFGELPRACIVRERDTYVTEDEIKDFVARQVSPYKRLSGGVSFVDSIPKTTTGKINRRELRKLVEALT